MKAQYITKKNFTRYEIVDDDDPYKGMKKVFKV